MNTVINLNKPSGVTSHQAVAKVKSILKLKKAGHAGTLDPMATGVLLICTNEATKIARFLSDMDKQYYAGVKLGERTDTYDSEGSVIEKKDTSLLSEAELVETVMMFQGRIRQKPPMYSAVKIGGRALYKLARSGVEIDRPERSVEIHEIKIRGMDLPYFDMTISCSKGTYVRTLCEDIGIRLGVGAHLVSLVRTGIGPFIIKDAVSFDDLVSEDLSFYSVDSALSNLGEIVLDGEDYKRARNGMQVMSDRTREFNDKEFVKLKGPEGNLFGIGIVNCNIIKVVRILNL